MPYLKHSELHVNETLLGFHQLSRNEHGSWQVQNAQAKPEIRPVVIGVNVLVGACERFSFCLTIYLKNA